MRDDSRQESPTARATFTWDAQNRLTRYKNGAAAVDYAYNAFDQRVERTTSSVTQKYVFDFDRILARLNAAGQTDRLAVVTTEEYGRLLTEQTAGGSEHHLYDALGSTVSLAGDGGSITDTYRYRAFGAPLLHTGSSDSPYTFVGAWGYDYDSESGLYLVRRRWLDPDLGMWLSSDPIDILVGDPNRYRYAFGNPNNIVDPSGQVPILLPLLGFIGKGLASTAVGGIVGGGINALMAWLCSRDPWEAFWEGAFYGAIGGAAGYLLGRFISLLLPKWWPQSLRRFLSGFGSGGGSAVLVQWASGEDITIGAALLGAITGGIGGLFSTPPQPTRGLVHLTNRAGSRGIARDSVIRGRHGIFAVPERVAKESTRQRSARTGLLPSRTTHAVPIPQTANEVFRRATPIGPYSLWKYLGEVHYTPPGAINTTTGAFARQSARFGPRAPIYGPDILIYGGVTAILGFHWYARRNVDNTR